MSGVAKYGTAHRSSTSPEPRAATLVSWRRRFEKRADDEERGAVHRSLPESPASPAQPQTRLSPADIASSARPPGCFAAKRSNASLTDFISSSVVSRRVSFAVAPIIKIRSSGVSSPNEGVKRGTDKTCKVHGRYLAALRN